MNISLIGAGLMGQALSEHLLAKNQSLTIFNRSPNKTAKLQQQGATIVASAQDALNTSEFCLLMLSDAEAINIVLDTIEPESFKDKFIIQMGTIAPDESQALLKKFEAVGASYLEAPVLGSIPEVKSGTLLLMVGATESQFQQYSTLFHVLGENPIHVGPVGKAAALKLAMNQLIAGLTSSFSLSLAFIQQQGVAVEQFMQVLSASALYAPTFDKKLNKMCADDFANPNFPLKHLLKDIELFIQASQTSGLDSSQLTAIQSTLKRSLKNGDANLDYSALYRAIADITLGHQ